PPTYARPTWPGENGIFATTVPTGAGGRLGVVPRCRRLPAGFRRAAGPGDGPARPARGPGVAFGATAGRAGTGEWPLVADARCAVRPFAAACGGPAWPGAS